MSRRHRIAHIDHIDLINVDEQSARRDGHAMLVADLMSSPVRTVLTSTTLAATAQLMLAHRIGSAVVVDAEGRCVGIATERDLLGHFGDADRPVSDVMTPAPDTLAADLPAAQALTRLQERGYRHLPVVDHDVPVGIVSVRDLVRLAALKPRDGDPIDVPDGLRGVVVAETEVGDVRGREGFYHYRQYDAIDLARHRTLDDVWMLMLRGALPSSPGGRVALTPLPVDVEAILPAVASGSAAPLDGLRTALSTFAAASDMRPVMDIDHAMRVHDAERICAATPVVLCALHRLRAGLAPVAPRDDLGYAANYLWMLSGAEADAPIVRAVERYLISTVDHGFNASTFTARVIASTGADMGACVVGAIGALSGPLHGGAPSRALDALDEIEQRGGDVEGWVRDHLAGGQKIMGFGHAVYRTRDPRSEMLKATAIDLGGDLVDRAIDVERRVVATLAELKPGREIYANVELFAGVVMERCGIPRSMFTPTFATSRAIGWCANVLEQAASGKIIRPSARYVGPPPRSSESG
jgi:citrate synthase